MCFITQQCTFGWLVYQESGWGVYPTSQNNFQPAILETVQSAGRKKKKQKMVRADPSLLGKYLLPIFHVNLIVCITLFHVAFC